MRIEHWLFCGRPVISQNFLHVSDVHVKMRYMGKFTSSAKENIDQQVGIGQVLPANLK